MKPYTDIAGLIESFEAEIAVLQEKINTLKQKPKSQNEKIILKYIETGSTGKTKDYVRELGIMSDRGTMYASSDVSKLIKDGAGDISTGLLAIARQVVGMKKNNGGRRK